MHNICPQYGRESRHGPGVARARAMSAARHVIKEILDATTQRDLLACRRSLAFVGGPVQCTRRQGLMDELTTLSEDPRNRQSICTDLLVGRNVHELRLVIGRLKGAGCLVPRGSRSRRSDLVDAIIHTEEYAPRKSPTVPMGSKGLCRSSPQAAAVTTGGPASSNPVETSTTLVAFDTVADPAKLKRKLIKKWSKRWAKFCKKKARRDKLAKVEVALQGALDDHRTATVGDLRAIVGQKLGIILHGKNRLAFDKALFKLTAPLPRQQRPQKRFKLADKRRRGK